MLRRLIMCVLQCSVGVGKFAKADLQAACFSMCGQKLV